MLMERSYTLPEFLMWTRRKIYVLLAVSVVPVVLYQALGWHWLGIPFAVIFLLGTTVALSAGFKNLQTYNRMQDAQGIWVSIASASRVFATACRDLVPDPDAARGLISRHLAWLATLRHEMRRPMPWETADKVYNVEYNRKHFTIPEREQDLLAELARYLFPDEVAQVVESHNPAYQAMALQSADTKRLLDQTVITPAAFAELQRALREFQDLQCRTERIKKFPYPRQHAFINTLFVRILCILLPFGMVTEFARLNDSVEGWARGNMVWFAIPLSLVISWMYASLDQVGEATENPFEGGANDVPITLLCEQLELDVREMLGDKGMEARARSKRGFAL
jgi:putative membrane protein